VDGQCPGDDNNPDDNPDCNANPDDPRCGRSGHDRVNCVDNPDDPRCDITRDPVGCRWMTIGAVCLRPEPGQLYCAADAIGYEQELVCSGGGGGAIRIVSAY
jgi:hypothetical protein